jgi:hypothetical protein
VILRGAMSTANTFDTVEASGIMAPLIPLRPRHRWHIQKGPPRESRGGPKPLICHEYRSLVSRVSRQRR